MSSKSNNSSRTARQEAADTDGEQPSSTPRLRAVPDLPAGEDGAADRPYVYEPPDVIGADRKRAEYREARPNISDEQLEMYVSLYKSHLSPATVASYEKVQDPFYKLAAETGFHPLKCPPSDIETYLLQLMTSGKQGPDGDRGSDTFYSKSYFTKFLSALKAAAAAQGLPSHAEDVDIDRLTRGYFRLYGSKLPDQAKVEVLYEQLVDIERREREGSTMRAATPRAAVALGCDPDLRLTVSELCALTFADVELSQDQARITTTYRGTSSDTVVAARPADPACPVAALRDLRSAVHRKMRADRGGKTPTEAQIGAESVFANAQTGEPLTRAGLKAVVAKACGGISGIAEPEKGKLPALTDPQRRDAMAATMDAKTARDLALVFHAAFTSGRVSEIAGFRVCDVEVIGHDSDGMNATTPLVGQVEEDGTMTTGLIDRIAVVTETDLLDSDGNSLYESRLITGVHNIYARGTKNKADHENWHPAQPGHPVCPVRLAVQWLKIYDRLMLARHGRRLAADDYLYTRLKNPGEPIVDMSHALSGIVKEWIGGLGIDPTRYSGHSLQKARDSFVLGKGGSMTECMVHSWRSSEVTGLPYSHRNPLNPLASDPTKNIYDKVADPDDEPAAAAAAADPDDPLNVEAPAGAPAGAAHQEAAGPPEATPKAQPALSATPSPRSTEQSNS